MDVDGVEHVLVMAKAPVPGRVKTRLQTRLCPAEAAAVAEAALRDTLGAASACRAERRVIALDGLPGPWIEPGFEVVGQGEGDLGARLNIAWRSVRGPGIQIGMDTPQVTAEQLDDGLDRLGRPSCDAVLGPATDGGWWALGLARPIEGVFDGVPMSAPDTGERQLAHLRSMGLRVELLEELGDLDHPEDLDRIAREHPHLAVSGVARSLAIGGAT
ncbi:MAG: glycosyltransferase [Acidimicrobiales bacterium]|nr:glycosyltransferase [Acidimicrobiales bacterium]